MIRRTLGLFSLTIGAMLVHAGLRRLQDEQREDMACKLVDELERQHVRPTDPAVIERMSKLVKAVLGREDFPGAIVRLPPVEGRQ